MPWWRNVLRLSPTRPKKPRKQKPSSVKFRKIGVLVTVGPVEGRDVPHRSGSRTIFFGISKDEQYKGGYAISEEHGELFICYWFGETVRVGTWSPIRNASSGRHPGEYGMLSKELRLGYDRDGEDIWYGYREGGLAYHASRWNIEM